MKKIELRHILPYMPYKLMLQKTWPNNFEEIALLRSIKAIGYDDFIITADLSWGGELDNANTNPSCKPVLLPLELASEDNLKEILKHLFKESKTISPCYNSHHPIKKEKGFITFYDYNTMQRYTAVKPGADGGFVLNMSNKISDYDVFFRLHIDMFGLIDAGMAVNKLTIPL